MSGRNAPAASMDWLLVELFVAVEGGGQWQQMYAAGEETVIASSGAIERIAAPWPGVRREVSEELTPADALRLARGGGFAADVRAIALRYLDDDAPNASYVVAYADGRCAAVDAFSGSVRTLA